LGVSSQKYKENVNDLHVSPQNVLRLRPVSFDWKSSGESDIGLIAEEVAEVIPELVIWDEQGDPKAVKYDRVAVCLLETVREQQRTIDELKTELASRSSGSTSANTSPSLGTCSGNATTNTDGYATVTLPEGLCAAGAEYRYQLTAVGAFAQAIVSQEVADGTFTIQTDQPNVTVSWQIVASAGVTSASHGTGDSADPLTCLDGKE